MCKLKSAPEQRVRVLGVAPRQVFAANLFGRDPCVYFRPSASKLRGYSCC